MRDLAATMGAAALAVAVTADAFGVDARSPSRRVTPRRRDPPPGRPLREFQSPAEPPTPRVEIRLATPERRIGWRDTAMPIVLSAGAMEKTDGRTRCEHAGA